ncbi:MAG TPA: HPr family phosphocarrier protein [Candidatus Latescibacteria bacterium]|jgi:phosphotransferase system HPr (HPr) family protein|nr:phosphocarrier protein HPr [Gemmatimonadota bacterium]MDP6984101.1 HPr family phosphocarrier protein [Candidatus Latescibacterota bacterium]MDP7365324.1 HPr family phosphocarrier protein [Candidatus Latescibacterota bacterium]MDP7634481.1 HPr family phosphocarrier protein [Candidatus Latescibacterota bacterium]MEC8929796.1 HPr family phosphocarrier protein [Candidatus Latescibacterota bacterium]|tara:strand:- start:1767 stop:2039 length:273 start_codon:yes stop_codon:yes gene_type:complete
MIEKTVVVTNRLGIHARPATVFVQAAAKFQADIFLSKGDVSRVNGKSIMGVMMLAAEQGAEVLVEAEGTDAEQAVDALAELLANDFEDKI